MTSLRELIETVRPEQVVHYKDVPVEAIACHPDAVTGSGFIFACINEYLEYNKWQTWRTHLEKLNGLQLAALIVPEPVEGLSIPQLITSEPREAVGRVARLLNGRPDAGLSVYGITGTNGKTTTTRLLAHLLSRVGKSCGSLGTLGIELNGTFSRAGTYTTPLSPEVYRHLAELKTAGASAVAMEVSSHALTLNRVAGLAFDGAVLTNIERDHLDFHGTQEAYTEAKTRLFSKIKPGGWAVLNRNSAHWEACAAATTGSVLTYGKQGSGADFELSDLQLEPHRSTFTLRHGRDTCRFTSQLAGAFQVENAIAAIGLAVALGYSLGEVGEALGSFPPVAGRMEQIPLPNGATAIVDYAHNPDGLRHVLDACRPFCPGKLLVVFGCGGDRDKGKRPLMGQIAAGLADVCWVTSDNPRTEEPEQILAEILAGMQGNATIYREVDRAQAIRNAYRGTEEGDVLLVAGKGHEDYQIIGLTKYPFSDQEVLRAIS